MAAEQPSTSEMIECTETLRAGDHAVPVPDYDDAVIAPEVAVDNGPEVYYDYTPPEAINGSEKETITESVPEVAARSRLPRKKSVVMILLSLLIVVVVVVTIAVETTKAKKSLKTSLSLSSTSPVASIIPTMVSISITPQSTPNPQGLSILNDSSFAAVTLENNDRYLYFQDQVGVVRQAIYNDVSQVPLIKVVASDARNHTPLAVLSVPSAEDPTKLYGSDDKSERIYLSYITTNDTLAIRIMSKTFSSILATQNETISVGGSSRYLSMTRISNQSSIQVCLFYEDKNGEVNAQRGHWKLVPEEGINFEPIRPTKIPDSLAPINGGLIQNATNITVWTWTWEDITGKLRMSFLDNNFIAPFSSSVSADGGVIAMFSKLRDHNTYDLNAFMTDYVEGTFKSAREPTTTESLPVAKVDLSTAPIDLLQLSPTETHDPLLLFWVNGTELESQQVSIGLNNTGLDLTLTSSPETRFRYSRLGGTVSLNTTTYYLYHQLDDVTIAEEKWSRETRDWISSNITV